MHHELGNYSVLGQKAWKTLHVAFTYKFLDAIDKNIHLWYFNM
jgi:hypothetical protein